MTLASASDKGAYYALSYFQADIQLQIYSDADISHIQKFAVIGSVCGVHSVSGFHGGKISLIWASQAQ